MNIENIKIVNPVTESEEDFTLVSSFDSVDLIQGYQHFFNVDISDCLKTVKEIKLYKCKVTGYEFFWPATISGNDNFYRSLQNIDWYYQPHRWEFGIVAKKVLPGANILDIGCGDGKFLDLLKAGNKTNGLELNSVARELAKEKGHHVSGQDIKEFSAGNEEKFDYVTAFQVLEHVSNVKEFVTGALKTLKKNGALFISVPNNDVSYFKLIDFSIDNIDYKKTMLLNMPPHHMGRWTAQSFKKAAGFWGASVKSIEFEPANFWRTKLKRELFAAKKRMPVINNLARISNFIIKKTQPTSDTMLITIVKK